MRTTDLAALHLLVIDAAVHPEGEADRLRDEAPPPDESATAAKAHGVIAAGLERDATALSPQAITEVTGIAATPNPPKGVQKRATRRVEEEMIESFSFVYLDRFLFFIFTHKLYKLIPNCVHVCLTKN